MSDAKADALRAVEDHGRSIDELHRKLAALPGCDKDRVAKAIEKVKAAHQVFVEDAQGFVLQ
jgi:SOS response regulatory protein OraA/RecX